jgi:hypothetical protein
MNREMMRESEWFGEIPATWKIERIKDIVATEITDGPHETPTFRAVGCAEQREAHRSRLMRLLASAHPTVWRIEA